MSDKISLYTDLLNDLKQEHDYLGAILQILRPEDFDKDSLAEGWTVKDQVSHLAFFDEVAELSATDEQGFNVLKAELEQYQDPMEKHLRIARQSEFSYLINWYEVAFEKLFNTYKKISPEKSINWFGPPMSAMSMVTARLMELWAHGYDITVALGLEPSRTDRLRHICYLGYKTINWSFYVNGYKAPDRSFYIEVILPSGSVVCFGDASSENKVTGDAFELAAVVTQRLKVSQSSLKFSGPDAVKWLEIAQAFAGKPKNPT